MPSCRSWAGAGRQAQLIARPLARHPESKLGRHLLLRPRSVPARSDHWESVRGAYATREGLKVDNLRVLLVDDVLTTDASLDACVRALSEAGAAAILGLAVAQVRSAGMVPGSVVAAHAGRGQRKPSQVI